MKLDCRRCTDQEKIENGCEKDSPLPGRWKLDDWEFQRCPKKLVKAQSYEYIRAYNFYKEGGGWPNPGNWPQQPLKLLQALDYIQIQADKRDETDKEK